MRRVLYRAQWLGAFGMRRMAKACSWRRVRTIGTRSEARGAHYSAPCARFYVLFRLGLGLTYY